MSITAFLAMLTPPARTPSPITHHPSQEVVQAMRAVADYADALKHGKPVDGKQREALAQARATLGTSGPPS